MDDDARVTELLGRPARGPFEVVVRSPDGQPVVIRNHPLLDDGTPMPTRYYLVDRTLVRAVSRLEADGGVAAAEASVDAMVIEEIHRRAAAERQAALPLDHDGPLPSGGVGGTHTGVKCLHAHLANLLAGAEDAIGTWTLTQLRQREPDTVSWLTAGLDAEGSAAVVCVGADSTAIDIAGRHHEIPVGTALLIRRELAGADPPTPEMLTNALGIVADHLDDIIRADPALRDCTSCGLTGGRAHLLARVELGAHDVPDDYQLRRVDAEDVFRLLVSETARERAQNPGLDDDADTDTMVEIVATCCIVLAIMRRLRIDAARVGALDATAGV